MEDWEKKNQEIIRQESKVITKSFLINDVLPTVVGIILSIPVLTVVLWIIHN